MTFGDTHAPVWTGIGQVFPLSQQHFTGRVGKQEKPEAERNMEDKKFRGGKEKNFEKCREVYNLMCEKDKEGKKWSYTEY